MQALTHEELTALLTAARARRTRDWLAFLVGYRHALRASEILNLRRCDVEEGYITVGRLKGSERTRQPLLEHTHPLFDERAGVTVFIRNLQEQQRLFPITDRQLRRLFYRYAEVAAIPRHKRHPHVLKHTCATELLPLVGIAATQRWLGHKSGSSTLMYTKVDDAEAARAVRAALLPGI